MLNLIKKITFPKIKARLHRVLLSTLGIYVYPAFWHYKLSGKKVKINTEHFYYAAQPNPGAGIGHQMANWIAGFHYAKEFGLKFAHIPFSTQSWEDFLGFGIGETPLKELKQQGYLIRRLPIFQDGNEEEKNLCKRIMSSYSGKKVVFLAEQDQFLRNLPIESESLQKKFFAAPSRVGQAIQYDKDCLNIAIHVRRGDIMADPNNPNLVMRYLSNDYFYNVLKHTVDKLKSSQTKPIHIWFFSQGKPTDYPEFNEFNNVHWCLEMNAQDSFLHMVYADVLITSKSSFSYKPALLNSGLKVCPENFWHGYPENDVKWILCENGGMFK